MTQLEKVQCAACFFCGNKSGSGGHCEPNNYSVKLFEYRECDKYMHYRTLRKAKKIKQEGK